MLKAGDIIRFRYLGSRQPLKNVLVLNPSYKGKLHGVLLDVLGQIQIKHLFALVYPEVIQQVTKQIPEIGQAMNKIGYIPSIFQYQMFYMKCIKKASTRLKCYRKFKLEKISSIIHVKTILLKKYIPNYSEQLEWETNKDDQIEIKQTPDVEFALGKVKTNAQKLNLNKLSKKNNLVKPKTIKPKRKL